MDLFHNKVYYYKYGLLFGSDCCFGNIGRFEHSYILITKADGFEMITFVNIKLSPRVIIILNLVHKSAIIIILYTCRWTNKYWHYTMITITVK